MIDLFCGVGGLTHGFVKEGFNVVAGIDIDDTCRIPYEVNNEAIFREADIADVTANDINNLFGGDCDIRVLIGCAPCQPFSQLNLRKSKAAEGMRPLRRFSKLIDQVKPEIISMENVKELAKIKKYPVFGEFLRTLKRNGYHVQYDVVNCSKYGVPQSRKRLVLLASRLGEISLIPETHTGKEATVRDIIGDLAPIDDGEISKNDPIHRASKLSSMNKRRIKATPPDGGGVRDWHQNLVLDCHKRASGKSYSTTVYGRMRWDEPAPTMTTNCTGLGNGRFGHPEQDRAISLREAALLQTFPKSYRFAASGKDVKISILARHVGNAVPVRLGVVIAKSIKKHIVQVHEQGTRSRIQDRH